MVDMAILKHEVWRDPDGLETCCLAGPMGGDARRALAEVARLVRTFEVSGDLHERPLRIPVVAGAGLPLSVFEAANGGRGDGRTREQVQGVDSRGEDRDVIACGARANRGLSPGQPFIG